MTTHHMVTVVGNPKVDSRTCALGRDLAREIGSRLRSQHEIAVEIDPLIDLASLGSELLDWSSPAVAALVDRVRAASLVLVASPTYKATFSGLLKLFLDRFEKDAWLGSTAIPVMTGGASDHALAVEVHLRPLLVELGAAVPTRGLYVIEADLGKLRTHDGWLDKAVPALAASLQVAA